MRSRKQRSNDMINGLRRLLTKHAIRKIQKSWAVSSGSGLTLLCHSLWRPETLNVLPKEILMLHSWVLHPVSIPVRKVLIGLVFPKQGIHTCDAC